MAKVISVKNKMRAALAAVLGSLLLAGCGAEDPVAESLTPIPIAVESTVTVPESNSESEVAESEPEESQSPAEPETTSVSLVMVGDILLHTPVAKSGLKEDGSYEFSQLFTHVEELLQTADFKLVNEEVIIGGTELKVSGYPAFNAPYELGDALVGAGFNVILHATNHAMDKGKQGVLNCLNFWQENYPDITVAGLHGSKEDSQVIRVLQKDGIRVAILNYTYGTNGISLPADMPYCVDLLSESRVKEDLARARELADFVVVCPHWGTEYVLEQTSNQKKWAKLFAQNGADLVIGTHPHVVEPAVWWVCEDGQWTERSAEVGEIPDAEEKMLVYYSLGNFVNWTSGTGTGVSNRMVGAMARVSLTRDEEDSVAIESWDVVPLVSHLEDGFGGVTVYPLAGYSAELGEKNQIRKQDSDFSYAYCVKLVQKVFGIQWE